MIIVSLSFVVVGIKHEENKLRILKKLKWTIYHIYFLMKRISFSYYYKHILDYVDKSLVTDYMEAKYRSNKGVSTWIDSKWVTLSLSLHGSPKRPKYEKIAQGRATHIFWKGYTLGYLKMVIPVQRNKFTLFFGGISTGKSDFSIINKITFIKKNFTTIWHLHNKIP